jgi:hypothetical protein
MPIPLIPVVTAILAGGALVPHAAGGLIVTSAAGYVTGTYLSTTAVAGIMTAVGAGAIASVGTLTAFASRMLAKTAVTSAVATTGVSATGTAAVATGVLSLAPALLSLTAALTVLGLGYRAYQFYELQSKVSKSTEGHEVVFTEDEAKLFEDVIKSVAKKDSKQTTEGKLSHKEIEELEKVHQEGFLSDADFEKKVSDVMTQGDVEDLKRQNMEREKLLDKQIEHAKRKIDVMKKNDAFGSIIDNFAGNSIADEQAKIIELDKQKELLKPSNKDIVNRLK